MMGRFDAGIVPVDVLVSNEKVFSLWFCLKSEKYLGLKTKFNNHNTISMVAVFMFWNLAVISN
jgi:hypothetical protein